MDPNQNEIPQGNAGNAGTMSTFAVPIAIVVAGVLIAGAVFMTRGDSGGLAADNIGDRGSKEISMRPVTKADHIMGNPDAPIIIVEYSDTECPFCKQFHKTMLSVIEKYGKDGQVAWVYRHFPLVQLHSKAPKEAEATECAAELGGKSAFWDYTNRIYEITPANNGLDPAMLVTVAKQLGIDAVAFKKCLDSGRHAKKVQDDYDDAISSGGTGTPHSVIITKDGQKLPLDGAQPLASVTALIDSLLKAK